MYCKQVAQFSRPYKYGKRETLKTKAEAEKEVKKLEQKVKTELSLDGIYSLSSVEILQEGSEEEGTLTLIVTTKIPNLF
mgnify:CR=1 FL=1